MYNCIINVIYLQWHSLLMLDESAMAFYRQISNRDALHHNDILRTSDAARGGSTGFQQNTCILYINWGL